MLAGSYIIQARLNMIDGEAMTMKEAISELIQRGYSHVITESDSQIFIEAISFRQHTTSEFNNLISHIK
jgi:ribonuclease HI